MNRFHHAAYYTNDGILSSKIEKSEILNNSSLWVRLGKVIYKNILNLFV